MISLSGLSLLIALIGGLVAVVNIAVEVIKKATWEKIPTNLLALIVSEALTLLAFFAYCQIKTVAVVWYMVAAAIVVGLLVAYAAMFGYDKLTEALKGVKTAVESVSSAESKKDGDS